ncbi:MAG: hypothetical protein Q7K45_06110 [Nanoarchaeota archaeon]|nr:hypothetical protein [Nanoarchaeota archaeon]
MKIRYLLLLSIVVAMILILITMFALADQQIPFTLLSGQENSSPSDWVKENQIEVYPQKVILDISGAKWAGFTNTNSMDPFIDETANAIEITPSNPDVIQVGDVIAYQTSYGVLIHRVIEKGIDAEGVYYRVKGDNNRFQDPFKVRFNDVQGVVVAVIY